ncbi:MAG: endonuclease domain-containing protein [Gammaproteobacteria bacterium]
MEKGKAIPKELLDRARALRQHQTDAENRLWYFLRNRSFGGFKFRRQHPAPPFVLDFYCHAARLGIELDGGQHVELAMSDARRSQYLEREGIHVIRFWNDEVLVRTEEVLEELWRVLQQRRALTPNRLRPPRFALPRGRGA